MLKAARAKARRRSERLDVRDRRPRRHRSLRDELLLTLIRGEAANPDEIGHTLRTTIVDRDGKLVKIYTGNEWTPAQSSATLNSFADGASPFGAEGRGHRAAASRLPNAG